MKQEIQQTAARSYKERDNLLQNRHRKKKLSREAGLHGQGGRAIISALLISITQKAESQDLKTSVSSGSRNSASNIIPG